MAHGEKSSTGGWGCPAWPLRGASGGEGGLSRPSGSPQLKCRWRKIAVLRNEAILLTLFIPDPTPAMAEVARALMAEHAELDLPLVIRIKAL